MFQPKLVYHPFIFTLETGTVPELIQVPIHQASCDQGSGRPSARCCGLDREGELGTEHSFLPKNAQVLEKCLSGHIPLISKVIYLYFLIGEFRQHLCTVLSYFIILLIFYKGHHQFFSRQITPRPFCLFSPQSTYRNRDEIGGVFLVSDLSA